MYRFEQRSTRPRKRLLALALALLVGQGQAADLVWTNTAGGLWKTASNWSPNLTPSASDNVLITTVGNYTVTMDGNASVQKLTIGGGTGTPKLALVSGTLTLTGSSASIVSESAQLEFSDGKIQGGSLEIRGRMSWQKGELGTFLRVSPTGKLELTGNGKKLVRSASIENLGETTWSGNGTFELNGESTVTNRGLFILVNDQEMVGDNHARFVNEGVLRKTSGGQSDVDEIPFHNHGTIEVQAGVFNFLKNQHTLNDGTLLTGAGEVRISGATVTAAGTVTTSIPIQINGGKLNGNYTVDGNLVLNGGETAGNILVRGDFAIASGKDLSTATIQGLLNLSGGESGGTTIVEGDLNFSGGSITGSVTANGHLAWTGGTLAGTLTARGTANWSGGTALGILNIAPGGQLAILNPGQPTLRGTLSNGGTTITTGQAALSVVDKSTLINDGLLEFQSEQPLTISGAGSATLVNSGTLKKTISSIAMNFTRVRLENNGLLDLHSGDITLSGQTHSFRDGTRVIGSGRVRLTGATLNLEGTNEFQSPLEFASGLLTGAGVINGQMLWNGGTIPRDDGRNSLKINGTLAWTGGELADSLTVTPLGHAIISGPGLKLLNECYLTNWGDITLAASVGVQCQDGPRIHNFGSLNVAGTATLARAGGARPVLNNHGTLNLGPGFGTFSFSGDLQQSSSGTLQLDIGGPNKGTSFNCLAALETASLEGALKIRFVNGYSPPLGSEFEIVRFTSRSGTFATYSCDPSLISPRYNATSIVLFAAEPVLTQHPQSMSVLGGTSPVLTAQAGGTAPVSYQWLFNGTPLENATNPTLTLANIQATQEGSYVVRVSNVWGSATSIPAWVTVNVPPSILTQPASMQTLLGSDVLFTVIAGGTHLSYQWLFNGVRLHSKTSSTLLLNDVQATHSGVYSVVVSNAVGTVTSASANLTVILPPVITGQPQSQTVAEGGSISLAVAVSGTPPMTFTWYHNSALLTTTTTERLDLVGVRTSQAGHYSVVVTNPAGSAGSSDAILNVTPAPPVTNNLVVHLKFDGDFKDSSGRGNHAAAVGVPNLVPGLLGSSGANVYATETGNNYVTLSSPADLRFGSQVSFSLAFWARLPEGAWGGDPALSDPTFISNKDRQRGTSAGWALATGADGRLQWSYTESGKKPVGYNSASEIFGNASWRHIAVTFERGIAARTYLDGALLSSKPLGRDSDIIDTALPVNIGDDGTGAFSRASGYWTNPDGVALDGLILDDLGIWRRALAPDEIMAIHNAGLVGRDISQVTLADAIGGLAPRITQQPVVQDSVAGADVTFRVAATGSAPLHYQWRKDGIAMVGATNALLQLVAVDTESSGQYSVVITNLAGSSTSMAAALTVSRSVRQGSVMRYDGSDNRTDAYTDVETDAHGNIYVTGYSQKESSEDDFILAKYSRAGERLWLVRYDGPGRKKDQAIALALDPVGNVCITGSSEGTDDRPDITTIKYDSNGNQLWVARYHAEEGKEAWASALAVDGAGNVIVAGSAHLGGRFGYATLKYSPEGSLIWVARYSAPANSEDRATKVALDASGNVYVTGRSKGSGTDFDYATVKYNSNGELLWATRYNGSGNNFDEPAALLVAPNGSIFVTGRSKGAGTDLDVATIKYSSTGVALWTIRYDGVDHKADLGTALALDPEGNLIVAGASKDTEDDLEFLILKYSPAGTMLLERSYGGSGAAADQVRAAITDANGNIFVTGSSKGAGTGLDFATLKYSPEGDLRWAARYNGEGNSDDAAYAMALTLGDSIVIAGSSRGVDSGADAAVVLYEQPAPPILLTHPINQNVVSGAAVIFSASAQGTLPLYWQWFRNEVPLPGATNDTFVLSNVQPVDRGKYKVVVRNAAAAVESASADLMVLAASLPWADKFDNRGTSATVTGLGQGTSAGASREAGEPHHAGKVGGKSLWLAWRAPASGIATFSTAGSDFDTVLGIYTGSRVDNLAWIGSDDDRGGFLTSQVTFNATAGVEYQIAVDGVNGASGSVVLSWSMEITNARLPVITSLSAGKTVGLGEQITLTVGVDVLDATFQWFRDGELLAGAQQNALTINDAKPSDVGVYYVRVVANNREILSQLVYLQINYTDDGVQRESAALDKFADMVRLNSSLTPQGPNPARRPIKRLNAPSRGYSGTQIFSTYGTTTEPGEPSNCGVPGGASAWFAYEAPVDGTLYVNTDGSDFDTTLGVYTGDGSSFDTLTLIDCDNDGGADGRCSAVRIPAKAQTTYYIAVDGVNGAMGRVTLNYRLGNPPAILIQPLSQNVPPGGSTTLNVSVTGTTPCNYQWRFNGGLIPGATGAALTIANAQAEDAGNYSVVVSNLIATVVSIEAQLTVRPPTVSISGSVLTSAGRPVPNVICQLSGSLDDTVLSGAAGGFSLNAELGGNYSLVLSKPSETSPGDGITTLDIALLRQRILGLTEWPSPYQTLAADVNQSGNLSTLDIALMRQVILGLSNPAPAGLWRFVPSSYAFADPRNPWGAPHGRTYVSLGSVTPGQDFVAIKLGDVNGSILSPSSLDIPDSSARNVAKLNQQPSEMPPVQFALASLSAPPGAVVKAAVTVGNFDNVTTAQFAVAWDPTVLRYMDVADFAPRGLSAASFGTALAGDGVLRVSWDDPTTTGVSLDDGTRMFTILFEVIGSPGSTSSLTFAEKIVANEATVNLDLVKFHGISGLVGVTEQKPLRVLKRDSTLGVLEVSFVTVPGVQYLLEFSDALSKAPWVPVSTFVGDGTEMLLKISGADEPAGFYRIRIQ